MEFFLTLWKHKSIYVLYPCKKPLDNIKVKMEIFYDGHNIFIYTNIYKLIIENNLELILIFRNKIFLANMN